MSINTTEPNARLHCPKNRPSVAAFFDRHYSDGQPAQPPLGPVQPDSHKWFVQVHVMLELSAIMLMSWFRVWIVSIISESRKGLCTLRYFTKAESDFGQWYKP